jgi:hypothetical protein
MIRIRVTTIAASFLLGLSLFPSSLSYGAPIEGSVLTRFPTVNVTVNDKELKDPYVPNFVVDNRAVVPLKPFSDLVGAFTKVDHGKIEVTRPNVNMIISTSILRTNTNGLSVTPFSSVNQGQRVTPIIYYVIDNVPAISSLAYKIIILDPNNKEIYSTLPNTDRKGNAWIGIEPLEEIHFQQQGMYKVQFLMRLGAYGDYIRIGQTLIKSSG